MADNGDDAHPDAAASQQVGVSAAEDHKQPAAAAEEAAARPQREPEPEREEEEEDEMDMELDEEDLELIAENTGVRRPAQSTFKRLRRMDADAEVGSGSAVGTARTTASLEDLFADEGDDRADRDAEEGEADAEAEDGEVGRKKHRGIYDTVVSDDDDDEDDDGNDRYRQSGARATAAQLSDEDDLDDFIVQDEDDDRPARQHRRVSDGGQRRVGRDDNTLAGVGGSGRHGAAAGTGMRLARDFGISDEAWNEVYDLFGDGSDYAYALSQTQSDGGATAGARPSSQSTHPVKSLAEIYEPAEVAEKMFTDRDDVIRSRDLPERFQLRDVEYRTPDTDELAQEARWVVACLKQKRRADSSSSRNSVASVPEHTLVLTVTKLLHFMRVDNLEVPFIARHRLDYFLGRGVDKSELWDIAELDERWNHIISKKRAIRAWSPVVPEFAQVFGQVMDEDSVKDLSDYLQLRYKREMEEWKSNNNSGDNSNNFSSLDTATKKLKRPVRKDLYLLARDAGLGAFAKSFGVSADQFGENFQANMLRHVVEDHELPPEQLAATFTRAEFHSASAVLNATKHMIANEIATNLQVRATLRDLMFSSATVNVAPTDRGRAEIDESHEYYPFKYVKHKPVSRFLDEQYLLLEKASKDGLLTVEISVRVDELKRKYESLYCNDNFSAVAERWNAERRDVLRLAFEGLLIPLMKRWIHERLINEAINYVAAQSQRALRTKLEYAPCRKASRSDRDERPDVRVFAISCGGGELNCATFGVLLNEAGAVVDHVKLNSIHGKDRDARDEDANRLVDFLAKYSAVDVVAVAGWTPATRYLYEQLQPIVRRAYDQNSGDQQRLPTVTYVADDCARIFQSSKRSAEEFPAYPPLLKYCVSLGRCVQEPLFEYAGLFGIDKEILFMKLHPLQDRVPPEKQFRALERVMMDVVNDVGVDINRALHVPHAAAPLQFICGLGPRKAGTMLTKVRAKSGVLESRYDLVREMQIGKCVFMNCASFLRISPLYMGGRRAPSEVLDNTRIHPEDYAIARKIAADALDVEEVQPGEDENPSRHVEEVMDAPQVLDDLMLDEYAKILFQEKGEEKHHTVQQIKAELTRPYRDTRRQFAGANDSDVFTMLTGETEQTLRPGMFVGGVVGRVKDRLATVQLDSGLEGVISLKNLSDRPIQTASEAAYPGQALRCRVLEVYKDRFLVELSALDNEDEGRSSSRHAPQVDIYFDRNAEAADASTRNKKEHVSRRIVQRPIQHPQFHNMDVRAAEGYLSTRPDGELLFRPSSRGHHRLTLSWKVADGIYQHVQIEELRKDSEYALGRELKIDELSFSDLDEIAALYVGPMARYVRELRSSPKFGGGNAATRDDLCRHVEREMLANPKRIPYVFGFSEEPGKFCLVYRLGLNQEPRVESVTVGPQGYTFRRCLYKDLFSLLNAFKATQFATAAAPAPVAPSASMLPMPPYPPAATVPYGGMPPAMYPPRAPAPSGYPYSQPVPMPRR